MYSLQVVSFLLVVLLAVTGCSGGPLLSFGPAEVVYEEWKRGTWVSDERVVFEYDSQKRPLRYTAYLKKGGEWTLDLVATYEYDDAGRLTLEKGVSKSGKEQGRTSYAYDSEGRLEARTSYVMERIRDLRVDETFEELKEWSKGSFTWNRDGRLEAETYVYGVVHNVSRGPSRYTWSYDSDGFPQSVTRSAWPGPGPYYPGSDPSEWEPSRVVNFTFDDSGFLLSETVETINDGTSTPSSQTTYTRDGDQLTEILQSDYEEGSWTQVNRLVIEGTPGEQVFVVSQEWESGTWENKTRVAYTYTNDGSSYLLEILPEPLPEAEAFSTWGAAPRLLSQTRE